MSHLGDDEALQQAYDKGFDDGYGEGAENNRVDRQNIVLRASLPSEEELGEIIEKTECSVNNFVSDLAKAIYKRIRG